MKGIILAKFTSFIRNPWIFLLFTGMSIIFALLLGNVNDVNQITVPVQGDEKVREGFIGQALDENNVYEIVWMEEEQLEEAIRNGKAEAGVIVETDRFEIIVGVESFNVQMIEQTVADIYANKFRQENLLALSGASTEREKENFLKEYEQLEEKPVFEVKKQNFYSSDAFLFDRSSHSLFGFTLFFVIYTICYNVLPILIEKKDGIWDRMILSPLKKREMYAANLVYSFFQGYLQVAIIFAVFRYAVGMDFNSKFIWTLIILIPYVFAIVALAILITAIVKNVQQFNAVLPIISVSMAMIGGAFWPREIVQSEILLALAKINPLTYGMDALNGLVLYDQTLAEILMPVSILILMGVIFIGAGIYLMERRHV